MSRPDPGAVYLTRHPDAPPVEPSAWLRMAAGRRLRQLDRSGVGRAARASGTIVMLPLSDVPCTPGSREDRTCDRCRTYVPTTEPHERPRWWNASYTPRQGVLFAIGLCERCAVAEYGPELVELAQGATDGRRS